MPKQRAKCNRVVDRCRGPDHFRLVVSGVVHRLHLDGDGDINIRRHQPLPGPAADPSMGFVVLDVMLLFWVPTLLASPVLIDCSGAVTLLESLR